MSYEVVGHKDLGEFDTEGAAVAAAWSVTPAGGKRPAIRTVVKASARAVSVGLDPGAVSAGHEGQVFIYSEDGGEWVDIGTARLPTDGEILPKAVLSGLTMVSEREGVTIQATLRVSEADVLRMRWNAQQFQGWMKREMERQVAESVREHVEVVGSRIDVEERPEGSGDFVGRPFRSDFVMKAELRYTWRK